MNKEDFRKPEDKRSTSEIIRFRVNSNQKRRLETLKTANGFVCMSDFCRDRLLKEDFILISKLNKIEAKLNKLIL